MTTSEAMGMGIRQLRERKGLRQQDIAAQANLSVGAVQRIEHGGNATIESVSRLLDALGYRLAVARKGAS